MKLTILFAALAAFTTLSFAAPSLDGEYLCTDCFGYLTLKKNDDRTYQVWLGVGGGSCGGDVFAKGNFRLAPSNKISIPWKLKGRKCTTEIEIEGDNAYVSDSCIKPEDEGSSTCAIMGEYIKRKNAK